MKLTDLETRSDIGLVLNEMGLTGAGVEIGVAFGENAKNILSKSNLSKLYLVDHWNYVPDQDSRGYGDDIKDWDGCYSYCRKNLRNYEDRLEYLRMPSHKAAELIEDESLDFVYIDGNHMSPFVNIDLQVWFPKVKQGGIFGGHDYYVLDTPRYQCDVKDAVDDFFEDRIEDLILLPEKDSSWYLIK